jgi:hypothetical protein
MTIKGGVLRVFLGLAICAAQSNSHAQSANNVCTNSGGFLTRQKEVGDSCRSIFSANKCISPGQLFVKAGDDWEPLGEAIATAPTTRISIWDPYLKKTIRKPAYEYAYVSDERGESKTAIIGVVAARTVSDRKFGNVNLYRNQVEVGSKTLPEFSEYVDTKDYQGYLTNQTPPTAITEVDNWINFPGSDPRVKADRGKFAYRDDEASEQNWKMSMRLVFLANSVTCTQFRLADDAHVKSVTFRLFIQGSDQPLDEYSAEFRRP